MADRKKWRVDVSGTHIGSFKSIVDARTAAKNAAIEEFDDFANYDINQENFDISKKFDEQLELDPNLNYDDFFKIEKDKLPKNEPIGNDSKNFKDVKKRWVEVKDSGEYKQVFLTGKDAKNCEFMIVDSKNYHLFENRRTRLSGANPVIVINHKDVSVHEYILYHIMKIERTSDDITIDHKNRVHFDNSEENLRPATWIQEAANKGLSIRNNSGVKGVNKRAENDKWTTSIMFGGIQLNLGCYKTKNQATFIYDAAAELLDPEFAVCNYKLRKAKDIFDFTDKKIDIQDLKAILSVLETPHRNKIKTHEKMIPSLIPYVRDQLEIMKSNQNLKRPIIEVVNDDELNTKDVKRKLIIQN